MYYLCAVPPDLSQLTTSFIASQSQGIHHTPLCALKNLKLYLLPDQRRFPDHQNKLLMMQKNYHVIDTLVLQTIQSDVIWLSTNNYYFFVLLPICQRTIADYPDA
jgi:hypothetical protein